MLSWQAGGVERLYLSPRAVLDGRAPIRAGVPVCWPQFSDRGPLPKHGFVRTRRWSAGRAELGEDDARLRLTLASDESTRALWPHEFQLELAVHLQPALLRVTLGVRNAGPAALSFTGALHTYLAVGDVATASVHGLEGRPVWDALTGDRGTIDKPLRFSGEFDRVVGAPAAPMQLRDGARALQVRQGGGWCDTVVWNPAAAKNATLADMPPDGWRSMLCIEAACVFEPVELAAGAHWQAWQELEVEPANDAG